MQSLNCKENSQIEEFSKEIANQLLEHNIAPQSFFEETILINQSISNTLRIYSSIMGILENEGKVNSIDFP